MTELRIVPEPLDVYWTPIECSVDWTSIVVDTYAISDATVMPISSLTHNLYYSFWEGEDDTNDFCSVRLQKNGNTSYENYDDAACGMSSYPSDGDTVRLMGVFVKV